MREIWNEFPSSLIKDLWDHTGILICEEVASRGVVIDNLVNTGEDDELESEIMSLLSTRARMSVRELVHPDGENECLQQLDIDICIGLVQEAMEGACTSDYDVPLPDPKEQLRAIAITMRIWEGIGEGNSALFRALRKIHAKIREQVREGQVQTKIDILLNKIYKVFGLVFSLA